MILIVEDDALTRGAMQRLFGACGYNNVAVGSAEEAINLVEDGMNLAAAVVDWDLPGMSGVQCIKLLKQHTPAAQMILITGADRERLSHVASDDMHLMRKPLDFQKLLGIVSNSSAHTLN